MNRAASERLPSTRPASASAAASATGAPNAGASDRASGASDAPAPDASASDARTGVVKTLTLACRRAWIRTGATRKCKARGAGGEQTEIFDYSFHIILSIWFLGCGAYCNCVSILPPFRQRDFKDQSDGPPIYSSRGAGSLSASIPSLCSLSAIAKREACFRRPREIGSRSDDTSWKRLSERLLLP